MLFIIAIILAAIFILKWYYERYQLFTTFSTIGIRGPEPNIWLGNLQFGNRDYVYQQIDSWFGRYGDCFGYYRGNRPILMIQNMELIQEVFQKRFHQFPNRLHLNMDLKPFNSSVIALRGKSWRHIRRLITPPFTAHRISQPSVIKTISMSSQKVFNALDECKQSKIIVDFCDDNIDGSRRFTINASTLSKSYTIDVISKIAFGLNDTDAFETDSKLMEMAEEFMANCDGPINWLMYMFPFLGRPIELINNYLTSGRMIDMLSRHLKKIIKEYQLASLNDDDQHNEDVKQNVIDYFLYQKKVSNLTENEVIGNLLVILLAGYETTACCLSFTLFNLAKNPQIQDRLRNKLRSLYDNENDQMDNLEEIKCEYLDRCIYESLRLYPPVIDYVIREISDDLDEVKLSNGLKIPKHVAIQVPVWYMHHESTIWPDPYVFNPERENLPIPGSSIRNSAFFAFGIGQRSCIGNNLAMSEIRHLITKLILRYKIELITDPRSPYILNYRYDQNRLLEIECNAELIKPKKDIYLHLVQL